jgi:hypothetical protein
VLLGRPGNITVSTRPGQLQTRTQQSLRQLFDFSQRNTIGSPQDLQRASRMDLTSHCQRARGRRPTSRARRLRRSDVVVPDDGSVENPGRTWGPPRRAPNIGGRGGRRCLGHREPIAPLDGATAGQACHLSAPPRASDRTRGVRAWCRSCRSRCRPDERRLSACSAWRWAREVSFVG